MANRIYRRTSTGTYPTTPIATMFPGTRYDNTGLASNTTYCYAVTAMSSAGESAKSNESCATAK
jgi:hypothetical protein